MSQGLRLKGEAGRRAATCAAYLALFPDTDARWLDGEVKAGRIVGDARGFAVVPAAVAESLDAFYEAHVRTGPCL